MAENVNSEQDELEPIDAMEGSFLDVSRTEEFETCSQRQNRCFTCDHCHKSFRKKYNLNRHVQTHTNDIKYKCVSCNQYFQTEEKREAHMSKKHYDQDALCDICGSRFGRKSYLKVHLKKYTEDPLNNICPFEGCRRSFSRDAQYQDHLNTHIGAKPYKCSNCVATFSCRYRKRRHEKVCMKRVEYTCETCSLHYQSADSLKDRQEAHHNEKFFQMSLWLNL